MSYEMLKHALTASTAGEAKLPPAVEAVGYPVVTIRVVLQHHLPHQAVRDDISAHNVRERETAFTCRHGEPYDHSPAVQAVTERELYLRTLQIPVLVEVEVVEDRTTSTSSKHPFWSKSKWLKMRRGAMESEHARES